MDRVGLDLADLRALGPGAWVPRSPLLALAASLLLAFSYFFAASLWGRIVRELGGPRLGGWTSVRFFMVANLGRYIPGKVWQIAGLAALARGRGVDAPTAVGAAVAGQGISLIAAALVGLGAVVWGPASMRPLAAPAWGLAGLAVVLALLPGPFRRLLALWFRVTRHEVPPTLARIHGGVWLGLYGAVWVLYAFSFHLLVRSFGYEGAALPVASAFAAAYVLGYLAVFAPAGVGVREGALTALLAPHLGVGPAGAVAVVARVWTTVVELVPAAVFWGMQMRTSASGDDVPAHGGEVPDGE